MKIKQDPRNLLTSLVLVFPLFLLYQIGVLFTLPMLNGADFLTVFLFRNLHLSQGAYLGYTALVAILFAIAVGVLRRRQRFDPRLIIPVAIESAIYALTMGSLIVFVMTRVFGISPRLAGGAGGAVAQQGLVVSAALFSAMHHIPPYGDPLRLGIFTFRCLAGVIFGLIFWFRGFAVAVYTHALYDLYVLLVQ